MLGLARKLSLQPLRTGFLHNINLGCSNCQWRFGDESSKHCILTSTGFAFCGFRKYFSDTFNHIFCPSRIQRLRVKWPVQFPPPALLLPWMLIAFSPNDSRHKSWEALLRWLSRDVYLVITFQADCALQRNRKLMIDKQQMRGLLDLLRN